MERTTAAEAAQGQFAVTDAERQVADLLPIEADPQLARAALGAVPFWFHTFALNRAEGIYTPGAARDHRYRVSALPGDFRGRSVLDVGTFDGFYAFLAVRAEPAEHLGEQTVDALLKELAAPFLVGDLPHEALGVGRGELLLVQDAARPSGCLLYTSPSPRDRTRSRMPSSA